MTHLEQIVDYLDDLGADRDPSEAQEILSTINLINRCDQLHLIRRVEQLRIDLLWRVKGLLPDCPTRCFVGEVCETLQSTLDN